MYFKETNEEIILNAIWLLSHLCVHQDFIGILEREFQYLLKRLFEVYETLKSCQSRIIYFLYIVSSITPRNQMIESGLVTFYFKFKDSLLKDLAILEFQNNKCLVYRLIYVFERAGEILYCNNSLSEFFSISFYSSLLNKAAEVVQLTLYMEQSIEINNNNNNSSSYNTTVGAEEIELNLKLMILISKCLVYLSSNGIIDLKVNTYTE